MTRTPDSDHGLGKKWTDSGCLLEVGQQEQDQIRGVRRKERNGGRVPRFWDRWICYLLRWGRPEEPVEVSAAWFWMGYV